jgi:hypothetical protein
MGSVLRETHDQLGLHWRSMLGFSLRCDHRRVSFIIMYCRMLNIPTIGPYGANVFDPRDWGGGVGGTSDEITLELTRVVLAIGVFAIGVELPKVIV